MKLQKKMCSKGKGILAADESTGTIAKRFKSIKIENVEKNRLNFRQTLFNSSAMKDYIGGVILFDETIRQKTTLGLSIPELISKHGAVPGIKVDKGAKPLAGSSDETVTEGLDGLRERLKEYMIWVRDLRNGELFIKFQINFHLPNLLSQMPTH